MLTLVLSLIVLLAVVATTLVRETLDLLTAWPLLLGAAVVLVDGAAGRTPAGAPALVGRLLVLPLGIVAAFASYLVRVSTMPDTVGAEALALALAIAPVVLVASALRRTDLLWSGLLGVAAFVGYYNAVYVADPPGFPTTGLPALTAVLLTTALGALVALAGRAVLTAARRGEHAPGEPEDATTTGARS